MSSKEVRYTFQHISPRSGRIRSRSKSLSNDRTRRSRSRIGDRERSGNPGNNFYVTGLSTRVTDSDLEKIFSKEGKVAECEVILDPCSKISRGFASVTMETKEDAKRCIKYLDRTVLEGRLITVQKVKRVRARTPTPGKYCGLRGTREIINTCLAFFPKSSIPLPAGELAGISAGYASATLTTK